MEPSNFELHEKKLLQLNGYLSSMGMKPSIANRTNSPYDILVLNKARLEVKVAEAHKKARDGNSFSWQFNIHRHGEIVRGKVDFYVFYIPPIVEFGFKQWIALIIPASEVDGKNTVQISPVTLMLKWGKFHNRYDLIKKFCEDSI